MTGPPAFWGPFDTEVHGTIFADRSAVVQRLSAGDELILVPDPPGMEEPAVWVHARGGDVIGHLPVPVAAPLAQWMLAGGRCRARVARVGGEDVESWRRLVITIDSAPTSS